MSYPKLYINFSFLIIQCYKSFVYILLTCSFECLLDTQTNSCLVALRGKSYVLFILLWKYSESTCPTRISDSIPFLCRLHNMIEIQVYRMRIGLNYCRQARDHLNYFDIYIIMSALLIGGIESNPRPRSDDSSSSSPASETFENHLSKVIFQLFTIIFNA